MEGSLFNNITLSKLLTIQFVMQNFKIETTTQFDFDRLYPMSVNCEIGATHLK